jgi:hypothetical protein
MSYQFALRRLQAALAWFSFLSKNENDPLLFFLAFFLSII